MHYLNFLYRMWTYVDGHKTYLTRMTTVCQTCESYAFIRREILSTQNSSCGFAVWDVVKAYASVFGAYTKLAYNDPDVFEKLLIRRIIRRKIRSCDRPISNFVITPQRKEAKLTVMKINFILLLAHGLILLIELYPKHLRKVYIFLLIISIQTDE